jgi:hypothetical protein
MKHPFNIPSRTGYIWLTFLWLVATAILLWTCGMFNISS